MFECIVERGVITIGDVVLINGIEDTIIGISHNNNLLETAQTGMDIYIILKHLRISDVCTGDIGYSIVPL